MFLYWSSQVMHFMTYLQNWSATEACNVLEKYKYFV